ncbi:MAG TPA: MarR family transcriptional regulator, partial [Actinomycetota bacterium]|nr:MarR family transcriptional regulator [Actinomycetota bacterium]
MIAEGRAAQTASDVLDEAAVGVMGINRTDGRCLEIMERSGGLTAGRLASESGLTTGAVTAVLDRLEQAGYVR